MLQLGLLPQHKGVFKVYRLFSIGRYSKIAARRGCVESMKAKFRGYCKATLLAIISDIFSEHLGISLDDGLALCAGGDLGLLP